MVLQVENLWVKAKDGKEILKGVSLEVGEGEVVVIMGRNGSGKSTLVNVIAGNEEYEITKGDVVLAGESVNGVSAKERGEKGLFVIFQHPIMLEGIKVGNLLYEIYKKKNKNANIKEFKSNIAGILKHVGLKEEVLKKYVDNTLSGGERKRLELAMLYLLDPKVIILDEIDSGMDIEGIKLITKIVKESKNNKKGVCVVTHYPSLVESMVDVVDKGYILDKGKIKKEYKDIRKMLKDIKEGGYEE